MPDASRSQEVFARRPAHPGISAAPACASEARTTGRSIRRIAGWALAILVLAGLLAVGWSGWPGVDWLAARQAELRALHAAGPWQLGCCLFALMTLLCAFALPGCSLVALAAGMLYGFTAGTLIVLIGSTVGATLAFLAARHLWRDAVRERWGDRLAGIEAGLARDGAYYLFFLRVAPVIPFGLLNPLLGLSAMPTHRFFVVSLLGMAAGSAAYVYAGTALAGASSVGDLFSPGLLAALAALALLPPITRAVWRRTR
ncbi:TVP38/TMEM64 family protein [Piscinibacter sakaiensis]|uniref:TVP38/TMEM64 family protein n=1 Tax=Piscinibacter sakaiensis TaxID=1547922 RepID=UPI003AAC7F0E